MLTAHSSQLHAVLFLISPAYNESQNIAQFVEEWYPVIEKHNGDGLSRLVVIDDGSKDNTYAILQDLAKTRSLIQPLTKPNSGHGATCIYGYRYALEHGAEYIFQTDSDGQTSPSEFEAFWELRNEYDAVLGKRPDRKDGAARVFISNVLRIVERIIFGMYIPDANVPYRLMKPELVAKYLPYITEDMFLANVMQVVCFAYFHENITFRDIAFRPRHGGESFVNVKSIVKIGCKTVRDLLKLRRILKEAHS